jgi:hypothetical protein
LQYQIIISEFSNQEPLVMFLSLASVLIVVTAQAYDVKFVYAQVNDSSRTTQPNINATNIHDSKTMVLGGDIKHLVILIPNEAHESPTMEEEQRHINQPYVPQR